MSKIIIVLCYFCLVVLCSVIIGVGLGNVSYYSILPDTIYRFWFGIVFAILGVYLYIRSHLWFMDSFFRRYNEGVCHVK